MRSWQPALCSGLQRSWEASTFWPLATATPLDCWKAILTSRRCAHAPAGLPHDTLSRGWKSMQAYGLLTMSCVPSVVAILVCRLMEFAQSLCTGSKAYNAAEWHALPPTLPCNPRVGNEVSGVATEAPLPRIAIVENDLNTVCLQVTLHHMDHVQVHPPLVAQGYTLQVMASAILADPASYLQQTVCVFQRMGTFAIAAGFDVRWWDGPVAVEDIAPYHPYNGGFPQVEALSTI